VIFEGRSSEFFYFSNQQSAISIRARNLLLQPIPSPQSPALGWREFSNTDRLICAVAIDRKMEVLTTDKDITFIANFMPIKLHEVN
jgi:hypothetical protein